MTTLDKINSMPVVPRSAVMPIAAFGQLDWGDIATSLIGAVGSIGGAAITAALAPSVKSATQTATTAGQPVAIQQPAAATNYTPWIIGGGLAIGGLILAMTMRRNGDSYSRRPR